ncbi:Muskelin N-terminus-domain-containing protein [Melanogaster broomeanus]|nr:Muskelin N-terminus-domain-containing protein [Melanogaster broomeanus]
MSTSTSTAPLPPTETIPYSIAGCSEHSGHYVADNIMIDRPQDQASRWSGAQQPPSTKEWILLRLETLSVVKSITFGKVRSYKQHPCNVKEFKLYVGLAPDHMIQALHAGLKDDAVPETFAITHVNRDGVPFPTRFIKIVPLSAHGHSFHISIWYVSVAGITELSYVERVRARYDEHRETVVLRQILKHLRERRLLTPYQSVLSRTKIHLEHPIVTALHTSLVLQGNWTKTESLLTQASSAGLFHCYIQSCQPHAKWKRLHGVDEDGDAPCKRGGHAMCLDPDNGHIYLFGGWDGSKSLDDFWIYDIKNDRWRLISQSTSLEKNGPVARSCHKMVFDTKSGCIYLLGKLGDGDVVKPGDEDALRRAGERVGGDGEGSSKGYCSEFYRYHTRGLDAGKWDLMSFDTASSGGPALIFDHQMVMDCEAQILYVSGGRVVDGDWESPKYSGLYSYNIRTSKWKLLLPLQASSSSSSQPPISPRFGHSMVLDPLTHTLFIFAGQRDDKYFSDMYAYDITSNIVTELFSSFSTSGGPDVCFTQRAVIDPGLREIYVFCGLTRAQPSSALTVLRSDTPNWIYQYTQPSEPGKWIQILPEPVPEPEPYGGGESPGGPSGVPVPRYAHQVVYDESMKRMYMHGGNAGESRGVDEEEKENEEVQGGDRSRTRDEEDQRPRSGSREMRLDDFWVMKLIRREVIRKAKYEIRRQRFREMCEEQPAVTALRYLQTDVFEVVDHNNPEETSIFRSLLAHLLSPTTPTLIDDPSVTPRGAVEPAEPPKKRSRPNTPDDAWTSVIDDDGDDEEEQQEISSSNLSAEHAPSFQLPLSRSLAGAQKRNRTVLQMDEDPEEAIFRDGGTKPLSAERFRQRTEVFESLLVFVGEDAKQPKGSLLDLVDAENGL